MLCLKDDLRVRNVSNLYKDFLGAIGNSNDAGGIMVRGVAVAWIESFLERQVVVTWILAIVLL